MHRKVIILEIKEEYALAMEEGGTILRIKKREGLREGDRIFVLPEDLVQDRTLGGVIPLHSRRRRFVAPIGAVAAMLALCVGLLALPQLAPVAYAHASFDGDASLQLTLGEDYTILSAQSLNASVSPQTLKSLKGMKLEDAAEQLRQLVGTEDVLSSVALSDPGRPDSELENQISALFPGDGSVALSGDREDVKAARESGMSLGLYLVGKHLTGEDIEDELEDLPLEDLTQLVTSDPHWMEVEEFRDAYEDRLEELEDQEEDQDGDIDDDDDEDEDEDEDDPPAAS